MLVKYYQTSSIWKSKGNNFVLKGVNESFFYDTKHCVVKSNVSVSGVMVIILECWGTLVKMQS